MSNANFMNIARLMTTYNLGIDNEKLPDNLKCVKCKLVLKDACLVPCGCSICRVCIDDLMANGREFCPGVSNDCRKSLLSGFVTDYRANKSVLYLTVKCPQNGCVHDCELAELEEHMRVCGRKSVACPFHELGCQQVKLAAEDMSLHFQQENRSHTEILIGMIADINREMEAHKREIEMLKRSDESNKMEIEMLKHELVLKDEKIRSTLDQMGHMENEIKSMKQEKADLVDRVRILSEKIKQGIDDRRESDEQNIVNVIEHIDGEISAITSVIGSNKVELDTAMTSIKDDIQSINQDSIKLINDDIDCIKSQMKSIQVLIAAGQIDTSFGYSINEDILKTSWTGADVRSSECFTGVIQPHKYELVSHNICRNRELLGIWLRIYPGSSGVHISWPLIATVYITVADKTKCEACRSKVLKCIFEKPSKDCRYSFSDPLEFSHSSLISAGLDLSHGVHVSCAIVPSRET